jgi:hypothetical protein
MAMFANCQAVIRTETKRGKKEEESLGYDDDVSSDDIAKKVRELAATGEFRFVGGYWDKPHSDECYRVLEWKKGKFTE